MNWPSEKEIKKIREEYPEGTIIQIIQMDDPTLVPPGTLGVVQSVDDIGNIHCNFPNYHSSLAVVPCKDQFRVIPKDKVIRGISEFLKKNMKYKLYGGSAHGGKSAISALEQAIENEKRRMLNCWEGNFDKSPEASNKRIMDDFNEIIKKQGRYYVF